MIKKKVVVIFRNFRSARRLCWTEGVKNAGLTMDWIQQKDEKPDLEEKDRQVQLTGFRLGEDDSLPAQTNGHVNLGYIPDINVNHTNSEFLQFLLFFQLNLVVQPNCYFHKFPELSWKDWKNDGFKL